MFYFIIRSEEEGQQLFNGSTIRGDLRLNIRKFIRFFSFSFSRRYSHIRNNNIISRR